MKFMIQRPIAAWVTVEVDAETEEEALSIEEGMGSISPELFVGGLWGFTGDVLSLEMSEIDYEAEPEVWSAK